MTASEIKIVCFDLGGVLVRICRSWEEGCASAGIDVREGFREPALESRRRAAVDALQRGALPPDDFWAEIRHCMNGVYAEQEIERVHRAWLLGEYEDITSLLERLQRAPVRTACLSNTNAPHWDDLVTYQSLGRLDHLYASHIMGMAKPDESIFRQFESEIGLAGGEILFFEDTAENAEAAAALGWRTHVVDPHTETAPQIRAALIEHGVLVEDGT
jgi:putative hydrolase of the HAD superfamily